MSLVLGLTGGIASGKSTVSHWLAEYGYPIVDADVIARQVVAPGTIGLRQLATLFSPAILTADGALDRQKLGRIVFADRRQLAQLTAITGPLIRQEINRQLVALKHAKKELIVLDVPLLFEGHYQQNADLTMVVYVDGSTQLQRLMIRNHLDEVAAKQRIASQWPLIAKRQMADIVIDNNDSLAATKQQVVKFLTQYGLQK
ncbi:dephospho-CoA kinase [Loigolactobacillus coryniformis]|jgi:dephospho-CoA kinase|uniref:Dephospho-CoA kinase n=4 Tax=Loigolactobacillus coryniformis TaxID=1610 RepID=J2ZRA9_9LACO|nr:dephospho-CoA kinase [Loigolactobacillus coryniformis]MDT3392678.1 dephospho-CoA kinase [Bacillota bacterium]RRG06808.1 MAG: dephospho-CoA kinase [Lactobacillus sp.]ATO55734.1 dephospho-CoA kinase [Loigolactobacillus coryniformis subsp. coryniformis KCTC 3167 = DSM 20001]EJN55456.1 Dephospho-CoA kinase [Loigolactobacillus coryniformis subsp. coryniformis CECT 5711]KRK18846.1 dephospho-CoA kinase [Loigolactobacillus coryniformis subsp. coryniformis KCTC 3167 = DSM 20001]